MKQYCKFVLISFLLASGVAQCDSFITPKPYGSIKIGSLEWLRCSAGQVWDGSTCIGQAKQYTFEQAKEMADKFNATGYGGKYDWRVPTVRELVSLRECSNGFDSEKIDIQDGDEYVYVSCNDRATNPTINSSLFPRTQDSWYWSSSLFGGRSDVAWNVFFINGYIYDGYNNRSFYVRLVR